MHSDIDDTASKMKAWLFAAFVISFASIMGSVGLLIRREVVLKTADASISAATIFGTTLILLSSLIFWLGRRSRPPSMMYSM